MNCFADQKNIGNHVLFITSLIMTLGTVIGGICWGLVQNELTISLLAGFSASMIFHWSFYFLFNKSVLPKRYADHLIAFSSCLLTFFIAFYNPILTEDMWVVTLYYPLVIGILGSKEVYKLWIGIYLILFHLYYFIDPFNQAAFDVINIVSRSSFALLSCIAGYIILTYVQHLNRYHANTASEQNKRHLFSVLHSLIPIVERKSQTTRNEIEEFRYLMKKMGRYFPGEMITDWEIDLISLLHYVSRINWPDYMFEKKEKLTRFEFEIIQEHCSMGAELISGFPELDHIKAAFLHHHERLDGKGYPEQLTESEISFLSQLIAVTESYVAMTTSRSYRHAFSKEEAFKEIYDLKGLAYREDIVAALEKTLEIKISDPTIQQRVG